MAEGAHAAGARQFAPTPRRSRDVAAASPHWLATRVGEAILEGGGSAVDACIAMNAVLSVVYPHMCGPGGDLFLLHWDAGSREIRALNGSGRAPARATPQWFRRRGMFTVPERGPLSATTPGAVAAWDAAWLEYGNVPLAELFQPAISVAKEGFEITQKVSKWIHANLGVIQRDADLSSLYLDVTGEPLDGGTVVRNEHLASTLERLGDAGPHDFYRGEIATKITAAVKESEGLLTRADLREHRSTWARPAQTRYRDLDVFTTPPNSQGCTALRMLDDLARSTTENRVNPGSADYLELLVRAKKRAFAHRDQHLCDPDYRDPGADVDDRGTQMRPQKPVGGDTVYMCSVDREGNACSFIQSIYYAFGSGFSIPGTGVVLHNRGHYFSLDDGHANVLAPRKRPAHTLMASLASRNGKPVLVFGTMGADGQPQTTVQVLDRFLAGMDPAAAVAAPRALSGRFLLSDAEDPLTLESDYGDDVITAMRANGHDVVVVDARSEMMGHAHAIELRSGRVVGVGVDPRSDGRWADTESR
jgi:gamma-glutamyltranspeptidase/glutathione hydrolase